MKFRSIAILGAGNLGISIAKGLSNTNNLKFSKIFLTKRNITGVESVIPKHITLLTDNLKAVKESDTIILCVQPSHLKALVKEIGEVLNPKQHIIISAITSISINELELYFGKDMPIVRAMPNTAISVLQSMTCLSPNEKSKERLNEVMDIFNCVGKTIEIPENLMQAATVICASGIAFWMRIVRATIQGGIQLGFDAKLAQLIAVQTCSGASQLLENNQSHPEVEIDKVTTPSGCTIAGLNEMEHQGLSSALIKGLSTSYEKISNMKH